MNKLVIRLSMLVCALCAFLLPGEASARESTGLPVVYINTEGGAGIISKDDYINAELKIEEPGGASVYDGVTEIKGHGNSTWKRFEKKAFKLKLDKSTDLFGMGKNKHWLLIANYIDPSCMRNMTSVEVAKILGAEYLDCVWVDVVLNGEEYGNFQLYEQARISENRVDIYDWETAGEDAAKAIAKAEKLSDPDKDALKNLMSEGDMSWISTDKVSYGGKVYRVSDYFEYPENNGGFLFELDSLYDEVSKFMTNRGVPMMFKKPEYICTDPDTMAAAQKIVQDMEDAIYSPDKTTAVDGVRTSLAQLCDMDSLVSYVLTNEIMFSEFGYKSTYMYKDTGDSKMVFGPIWDLDWSSDNIAPFGETPETGWFSQVRAWFIEIMRDPYFAVKARETYAGQAEALKELTAPGGTLEQWKAQVGKSALQNESLWYYGRGFEEDYQTLVDWLQTRTGWISSQMTSDNAVVASMGSSLSSGIRLSLSGAGLYGVPQGRDSAWFGKTGGSFTLKIAAAGAASANLYVNGIPVANKAVSGGSVSFVLDNAWLTEETGRKNVLVVRTLDGNGSFTGTQFATLTLSGRAPEFCTVTFVDRDGDITVTIPAGEGIVAPESCISGTAYLQDGWKQRGGSQTVKAGELFRVTEDAVYNYTVVPCHGKQTHKWTDEGDVRRCSVCGAEVKLPGCISMTLCTYDQSSRYGTVYKGTPVHPTIAVYYGGRQLTEGVEYNITYRDNVNAGFGVYEVTGIPAAGFGGKAVLSFGIKQRSVSSTYVKVKVEDPVYTGAELEPAVTLTSYGNTLVQGVDYQVSYSDNVAPGTGTVTVTGIGRNFTGETVKTFTILPVGKPAGLKAAKVDWHTNEITWTARPEAVGYEIYRSDSASGEYVLLGTSETAGYRDEKAAPGQKCYYRVAAVNRIDGTEYVGQRSGYSWVTTKAIKASGLKVQRRTCNSLSLSWMPTEGADGYQIYRSFTKDGTYTLKKTVTGTSCNMTGLTAGKMYYYKIKAYAVIDGVTCTGGFSGYSSAKTAPVTVTGLKASSKKAGITLTWDSAASVTGYKVYRLNEKTAKYVLIATVKKGTLTYTDKKGTAGKSYTYKVRAYKTVGEKNYYGSYSAVVTAKRK